MKKIVSKICIRCGSEKGEDRGCNIQGTFFKQHIFTYMQPETKEEKRIEELEMELLFSKKI